MPHHPLAAKGGRAGTDARAAAPRRRRRTRRAHLEGGHCRPARASARQRTLSADGDQLRRQATAAGTNSTSRAGAPTRRSIRGAASSTFATCASERSGRRRCSRVGGSPGNQHGGFLRGSRRVPPACARNRDHPGCDRGRRGRRGVAPRDRSPIDRCRTRQLEFTSYVELALAPHRADTAHPAFAKMFVETEMPATAC